MNDALMIGIVLTLVFGAVVFYLYNRLSMTERKMGLVEGVLTDLKIMMDAAPFLSGPFSPDSKPEFEPTPEYLNAISGPFPLKKEEVEEVEEDYKIAMEQTVAPDTPYKSLQIDELAGSPLTATNAISVTKLSPDLEAMSIKELQALAKQNGLAVPAGTRRKGIMDIIKNNDTSQVISSDESVSTMDGPELKGGAPL